MNEDKKVEIFDNFLSDEEFRKIKEVFLGEYFPWYISESITTSEVQEKNLYEKQGLFFGHILYANHRPFSEFYNSLINPFLNRMDVKSIIRIKANLYPYLGKYVEHNFHTDQTFPHSGAIFYINNNNGFTILEDGTKLESVQNRMVFLNTYSILHKSTNCTNDRVRITINFNYF